MVPAGTPVFPLCGRPHAARFVRQLRCDPVFDGEGDGEVVVGLGLGDCVGDGEADGDGDAEALGEGLGDAPGVTRPVIVQVSVH